MMVLIHVGDKVFRQGRQHALDGVKYLHFVFRNFMSILGKSLEQRSCQNQVSREDHLHTR